MHAYLHTFIGDGRIYVIPQIFTCLFLWKKKVSWWKLWQTSNLLFSYSLWSLDPNIQSHFYVLSISICIFTAVFWSKQSKWDKIDGYQNRHYFIQKKENGMCFRVLNVNGNHVKHTTITFTIAGGRKTQSGCFFLCFHPSCLHISNCGNNMNEMLLQ